VNVTVPSDCASEVSQEFLQRMANAMCVSFHKYGPVKVAFPGKIDAMASARDRIRQYSRDGNAEHLVDAANFLMIEAMRPAHPDAHYEPTDSDASRGRVAHDGSTTTATNDQLR
jgi:hypothetical protein